ncbi:unnamed protein product, partial [Pylaiella littoralis]
VPRREPTVSTTPGTPAASAGEGRRPVDLTASDDGRAVEAGGEGSEPVGGEAGVTLANDEEEEEEEEVDLSCTFVGDDYNEQAGDASGSKTQRGGSCGFGLHGCGRRGTQRHSRGGREHPPFAGRALAGRTSCRRKSDGTRSRRGKCTPHGNASVCCRGAIVFGSRSSNQG